MDTPGGSPNGVSGWIRRAGEIGDVINRIGLPVVLLGLVAATYFGGLTSPYSAVPGTLAQHDAAMTKLFDARQRVDLEVLDTLRAMRADMARNSAAYRVRICAEIRDVAERRRCTDL